MVKVLMEGKGIERPSSVAAVSVSVLTIDTSCGDSPV
jgi:hypothetical protein